MSTKCTACQGIGVLFNAQGNFHESCAACDVSSSASPAAAVPEGALPPLPVETWINNGRASYTADQMQAYARAAVEADRARQQQSGRDSALRAEPAVRVLSAVADMTDEEVAEICVRVRPTDFAGDNEDVDYLRYDAAVIRAVCAELATRCRAEGGDGAPEAVDVSADRAQQGEPVGWIERAVEACRAERVEEVSPEDVVYNTAIENCVEAIRDLATKAAAPADAPGPEQSLTLTAAEHGTMPTRIQAALDLLADATLPRHVFVAVSNALHACNDELFRTAPVPDTGIPTAGEVGMSPLYKQALEMVRESSRGSVAMVQRRLRIGWAEAENLIHTMVQRGDISHEITSGVRQSGRAPAPTTPTSGEVDQARELAIQNAWLERAAGLCDKRYQMRAASGHPREASAARSLGEEIRQLKFNPSHGEGGQ